MNILHISNGYADSAVHKELIKAIDSQGVSQTVYCPVREKRLLGANQFEGKNVTFIFSYCIKSWYKFVYHFKLYMLFKDLLSYITFRKFDIVYASSLFSDGGLAFKLYKRYGIPYVVAVRNTDINLYIKKLVHTHRIGRDILKSANNIVFISKSEMEEFSKSEFVKPVLNEIKDKFIFQPNGINCFWHQNITHTLRGGHDILYIGNYTPDKNVARLAKAVIQLRKEVGFENVRLIIVGGEKEGIAWKSDERILEIIKENPEVIKVIGKVYDKDKLLIIMRSCAVFAMPSIHETFGLVYLEALSQNLPVIYTKGQGIDGIFDNTVGISVNALSVKEIKDSIKQLLTERHYDNRNVDFSLFDWHNISSNYLQLFSSIVNKS